MPFPHNGVNKNPEAIKYDKMTAADRIREIKDTLTNDEYTGLVGFILLCSGGTLETMSFYEFLHWWALCNYSYEYCIEYLVKYKFHGGQSSFAINFFNEALATGRLSYAFNCPISKIRDLGRGVQITSRDGRSFQAKRLISTIPLNVLSDISFDPPLAPGKQAAIAIGHVNQCVKVHAEVKDRDLRSWSGISHPNTSLIYAFGDGTTPSGNTHIVAFGAQDRHLEPDENIDATLEAVHALTPMNVERLVSSHSHKAA